MAEMNFATPLCELAFRYGTDKCPQIGHQYTPFYYELMKDRRELVKKVVEIGIGYPGCLREKGFHYYTGASLRMWRDFFPNAHVYGADFREACMFMDNRITTVVCNEAVR